MVENSAIEWTDHTFNPWEGCQKVGPGCDHCYAETRNARFGGGVAPNWGPGAPRRRTSMANWRKPLAWQAAAAQFFVAHGRRQRVFCASLADVFDNAVLERWRQGLFELIEATPDLDWLLLTKRIGNVAAMTDFAWGTQDWPANVWLGATIVNQVEADRDIPKLLATEGPRRRFLSMEPLLGEVDISWALSGPVTMAEGFLRRGHFAPGMETLRPLDWVIVGGESGAGARPMHPDWARSLRDQCEITHVPFLFKQWGEWAEVDNFDGSIGTIEIENDTDDADTQWSLASFPALISLDGRTYDRETLPLDRACRLIDRVGKRAAGRLLDGVTHDGVPT
jgi:protein gp37